MQRSGATLRLDSGERTRRAARRWRRRVDGSVRAWVKPAAALVGFLAALTFAPAGAAQSPDTRPDPLLPTAEEGRPALGIETTHELGAPLGTALSGAELDQAVDDVANLIRCPKCQALSIADSGAQSAQAMRREARSLLAAGYTREQVIGYFEQRYGEFVLLEPPARGLNRLVWVAPTTIILVGALLVARRLLPRRRSDDEDLDVYLQRVEQETTT